MAITSLYKITGDPTPNNFDGPSAGWSIGSGTTFANTGLRFGGDGAAYASAGNKGTLIAWSGTGKDAKPSWATGPGFIETSSTNLAFEAIDDAAITRAICEDGLEFSCGIQFSINSYAVGTSPPNNTGVISIHSGSGTSEPTTNQFRILPHNISPGWTPSISIEAGVYTGTGRRIFPAGGQNSLYPMSALSFDRWYKFRARVRSSTADGATTGEVQYWINDQLVMTFTDVDTYFTDPTKLVTFCGLLNGYTAALSGVRIRHCGPYEIRRVPQADIQSAVTTDWSLNTTLDWDTRRLWPVCWNGLGAPSVMTGAATSPALGELNSSGGVQPGRYVRIINGIAGQGFSSKFPAYWGGQAADNPFGANGYTHINFLDLCCKNLGIINAILYAADNVTPLITATIDGVANTFTVNGVQLASSLAANSRWQVVVQLRVGGANIILQNITDSGIVADVFRSWAVACSYAGGAIGQPEISGTFSAPGYMLHGGVAGHAKLTVAATDSYASAAAFMGAPMTTTYAMPVMQCNGNHLGVIFKQLADGESIPGGHDPLPYESVLGVGGLPGITIGMNAARSGYKLSQAETYYWPGLNAAQDLRWLVLAGDVNDTSATTTDDLMIAQANAIAERKKRLVQYALAHSSEVVFINAFNLPNAGAVMADGVDANNVRRRIVPEQVAQMLPFKLQTISGIKGKVRICDPKSRADDAFAFIGADGIHPISDVAQIIYRAHLSLNQAGSFAGNNSDGTLKQSTGGSSAFRNRS